MAYVDIDTILHVFTSSADVRIGQNSIFVDEVHPGTNKKIEGWKWDKRLFPDEGEFRAVAYAPSIWDPNVSGLDITTFQSGFGDNDDLRLLSVDEVIVSGEEVWAPKLHHGFFYSHDEEWYLYSDGFLTEYFSITGVEDDKQTLTLSQPYKPTIPIRVQRYQYDRDTARYFADPAFRKKVAFSTTATSPEFILDTTSNPPKVVLDSLYSEVIGGPVSTTVSGSAVDVDEIYALDVVGISDGTEDQEFYLKYSPVEAAEDIEVWSWADPNWPTQWEVIDSLTAFTTTGLQVKVDVDRGVLIFGNYDYATATGDGRIPSKGIKIGAYYTRGVAVEYEPLYSLDDHLAYNVCADTNPIRAAINQGFVQITTDSTDPASIVLNSNLTQVLSTYTIDTGNNIGLLSATVRSSAGDLLEGQEVTFEILDPTIGAFGTIATEAKAATNINGQATVVYNPPITSADFGQATLDVSHAASDTYINVIGLSEPSTTSGLVLYKVHKHDEVLGLPATGLDLYYENYLDEEAYVSGVQGTQDYEIDYRNINELLKPTTYEDTDLVTGKKTIMLTTKTDTMNPHTGLYDSGAFVPLTPIDINNIGSLEAPVLRLRYNNVSLDLPGIGDTKAYFVTGNSTTRIRAYVTNRHTGKRVYSNIITIEVQIPNTSNGTYYAEVLNDIPSGLLTHVWNVDTELTDNEIEATKTVGTNWDEYLAERIPLEIDSVTANWRSKRLNSSPNFNQTMKVYNGTILLADMPDKITSTSFASTSDTLDLVTFQANWRSPYLAATISTTYIAGTNSFYISYVALDVTLKDGSTVRLQPVGTIPSGWNTFGASTPHEAVDEHPYDDGDFTHKSFANASGSITFLIDTEPLYETYIDWYRRTRRGDSLGLADAGYDIVEVTPVDVPANIPLGFRLRSGSITIASLLDQVTYVEPNDYLPSGYFE